MIYNFMAYLLNYLTREYELAGTLGSKVQVGFNAVMLYASYQGYY